jgi:hypothetical protein
MAKKDKDASVDIMMIERGVLDICVLGTTPIILNRISNKAAGQLLMPPGRKSTAEKAASLKHVPMDEFRSSPYMSRDRSSPTLLQALSVWFKKATASVALDMPGVAKTQLERLLFAEGERIPLYGVPQMLMSIVRSADIARTPDVRSRAIIPKWACRVQIKYTRPILREQVVANLFASAGFMRGVGDWRAEKGSGQYGSFEMVNEDDPRYTAILAGGGRQAQIDAMNAPEYYDEETEELHTWFLKKSKEKGFEVGSDFNDTLLALEAAHAKNGHDPRVVPPQRVV